MISLWDMALGSEDILFATSMVPNDIGYGMYKVSFLFPNLQYVFRIGL